MHNHPTTHDSKFAPGAALVIVLSMVSLLTLLAIALLMSANFAQQRTALETATKQSEALAQTAFQTVMADLLDEMEQGASAVTENTLADDTTLRLYDLSDNRESMRPTTSLRDPSLEGSPLIKQSNPGQPFHSHDPALTSRASSVPTHSSDFPLATAFWEAPRILPSTNSLSNSNTPTWVYLTRGGANPTAFSADMALRRSASGATNDKYVMGRYAYNLYDLSGALDINAAGFPATGGPEAELAATKGSLAFADLTQLPGMSEEIVDALATWKHEWGNDDEDYIRRAEGAGWMSLVDNDNLFLSRQDLLRFADRNPQALAPEALPYLTHFSRDLDAPSFRPNPDRPKVELSATQGGNDAKGVEDELNPPLTDFNEDRERQLLDRRFPLERLKWVATPQSGGPVDAELAERYFGLRWTGTIWEYVHARPSGDLYTLQDVPANREPNFFEILRASINVGSLGRQYAARGYAPGQDLEEWSHRLPNGGGKGGLDGSVNRNILEMGACIIDQYDADSYPSAIQIKGAPTNQIVYGKEDLPYLAKTVVVPYRGKKLGVPVYNKNNETQELELAHHDSYEVNMTLQAGLWRPHQPVPSGDYIGPSTFRLRPVHIDPFGGSLFRLRGGWEVPDAQGNPNDGEPGDYSYWGGPNYRDTHPELYPKTFTGDESMTVSFDHSSNAFREPQTVHSPAHASQAGYTVSGSTVPIKMGDLQWYGTPSTDLLSGFLVGKAMAARWEEDADSGWRRFIQGWFTGKPLEFILEYQGPGGSWRRYQQVESTYQSTYLLHYQKEPYWDTASWIWTSLMIDPRTNRFGGIGGTGQCWTRNNFPSGASQSGPNAFASRLHWPEGAALRWETNKTVGSGTYTGVWSWWRYPAANTGWSFNKTEQLQYWWYFQHAGCLENNIDTWNNEFTLAYRDPDSVLRPGVGVDIDYSGSGGVTGNPMSRRYQINSSGVLSGDKSLTGRPRILNRAFRSVGELACAFRGTPWKDIDFLDPSSPDAALLDVFRLYEYPDPEDLASDPVVAGRVNLNSASEEALKALFAGALVEDQIVGKGAAELKPFTDDQAAELASKFRDWVDSKDDDKGLLLSMADLVQGYSPDISSSSHLVEAPGLARTLSEILTDSDDRSINDRRESAMRALSSGTTVRSWTFMLDLVVQSGSLRKSASSLEDFNSKSEQRYWIHFSLDRFTGKLLDLQWEKVSGLPGPASTGP